MTEDPIARLPDAIELNLREASAVLAAVDIAVRLAAPGGEAAWVAGMAQRLLTRKLWPELGDLLDEEEE